MYSIENDDYVATWWGLSCLFRLHERQKHKTRNLLHSSTVKVVLPRFHAAFMPGKYTDELNYREWPEAKSFFTKFSHAIKTLNKSTSTHTIASQKTNFSNERKLMRSVSNVQWEITKNVAKYFSQRTFAQKFCHFYSIWT